jgi:hypothetical protein
MISFGTTGKGVGRFPRGHKSLLLGEVTGIVGDRDRTAWAACQPDLSPEGRCLMVVSINSDKVAAHHNPVPNAAIMRGVLVTSGILGKRLDTDDYPVDRAEQTALVFTYLEAILDEAGASPQDVVKLDLYFA